MFMHHFIYLNIFYFIEIYLLDFEFILNSLLYFF